MDGSAILPGVAAVHLSLIHISAPAEGGEKPVFDPEAPNRNPVEAGPAVAPKDESGKFDPTKIAEASDFGDWEEQGCKG